MLQFIIRNMNTEHMTSTYCDSPLWNDHRIYNDSKGRPVGIAGKVNRITHEIEQPTRIPLMTPEDKIISMPVLNDVWRPYGNIYNCRITTVKLHQEINTNDSPLFC